MAGRLNTKFLLIVIVALVVIAGGGLGLYALAVYKSVDERMTLADQYMAEGNFSRAAMEYGKVVHKTTDKRELVPALIKFYDAKRQVPVAYGPEAYDAFQKVLGAIDNAVREAPDNPEIFQRYMDIYMELGLQLSDAGAWNQMFERADMTLRNTSMLIAHKYRGLAQVNRLRNKLNLSDEERAQAREDLKTYLERQPDDAEAVFHLAVAHILEADILELRTGVTEEQVKEQRDEGVLRSQLALERHPDDVHRALDYARVLLLAERRDEARAIITDREADMLANPGSRQDVLTLFDLIGSIEVTDEDTDLSDELREAVQQRRHRLLAAALEAHPDDLVIKVTYGRSLSQVGQPDEALAIFQEVRDVEVRAPALEAFVQTHAQQMATVSWANLKINAAEKMADADAQRQELDRIDQILKSMRSLIGESNAYHHMLHGKLYLLREKWVDAAQSLRQADNQFRGTNPEVLLRLAVALEKTGQGGAAIEALHKLLQHRGLEDYMPAKYRLVVLNIKYRQYAEAEDLLDQLVTERPEDEKLGQLRLQLCVARGDTDQAIALIDKMPFEDELKRDIAKADIHRRGGDIEAAARILRPVVEIDPTNEAALRLLVVVTPDKDAVLQLLAGGRAAGITAEWLDQEERRLKGEARPEEIFEERLAKHDDFTQHVARYQVLSKQGKWQEAEAEFAKARALRPEDPWVINESFARAVRQGRWDDAEDVASRAASLDIDRARGMFFQGRLAMARQAYDRAADSFREGLDRRPDFSLGWRLLGDAQRATRDFPGAVESYRKAMELVPDNLEALEGLAAVHSAREEHELALDQLRAAHSYDTKNRPIRNAFLGYLQEYGDKQEALRLRRELVESDADDDANRRALSLLLADLEEFDEANATLDALIEDQGLDLVNAVARASLLSKADDNEAADELLEQYVLGLGSDATANDWLALARFRVKLEMREPALSAYRKAIALEDPAQRPATQEMAERLFMFGELEEASKLLETLRTHLPHDRRLAQRHVETLVLSGRLDEADTALQALIAQHGDDHASYLLKAMVAGRRGKVQETLEALEHAEKLNPQVPLIYIQRARIFSAQNRVGEARKELSKALRMAPNDEQARLLLTRLLARTGEYDAAINELQSILKRNEESGEARLQLARLYMTTDRLVEAREVLDASLEKFPDEWRWPYELAQLDRRESRPTKAAERLQQAFDLEHNPDLLNELAVAHIQAKRPEKSLDVLRDNHDLVDQYPMLNSVRGWALGEVDRLDEATEAFRLAINTAKTLNHMFVVANHMKWGMGPTKAIEVLEGAVNPDNRTLVTLVLAQFDLDDHNFTSTVARIETIDDQVPIDSPLRRQLDTLLSIATHQTGDYERAKDAYLRLIEINPRDVQSLNNLAYLLSDNLNQPEAALPHIRKASELVPANAQILDTLGWIQFKAGQREDGKRSLRESVNLRKMPANCLHMAEILLQERTQSAVDEALIWLKRAKRLAERFQDKTVLERASKLLEELEPTP